MAKKELYEIYFEQDGDIIAKRQVEKKDIARFMTKSWKSKEFKTVRKIKTEKGIDFPVYELETKKGKTEKVESTLDKTITKQKHSKLSDEDKAKYALTEDGKKYELTEDAPADLEV